MARKGSPASLSIDQLRKFVQATSGTGKGFKTINISANGGNAAGQSSVVADAQDDTLVLKAGANITLTGDSTNDAITIAGVSTSSNSFETIAVTANGGTASGDSRIAAESGTDTLNLVSGSNITICGHWLHAALRPRELPKRLPPELGIWISGQFRG